ncbi:MAG TPA: cytochrome c3 family protein [Terriglobia bacterium]|nr:cytochrome c3 family protein [Terriglobia bacterium]
MTNSEGQCRAASRFPSTRPFLAMLTLELSFAAAAAGALPDTAPHYVGSQACQPCHAAIYNRWKQTRMANVVRDPRVDPQAFLCDFSKPNTFFTFRKSDIAFVYGSHWKQRYFVKRGNDYFVLPVQWDIVRQRWEKYHPHPGDDWWVPDYPDSQMQRPTGPLCDGCHSVNYDVKTKTVTEWNVGCERCHGPGSEHIQAPWNFRHNIVNPARLDFVRANDDCIQCHSQLRPLANPIQGVYYDWAVGYKPGDRLSNVVRLENQRLGVHDFFYWPDGSAQKNRMQGNDFVTSAMYEHGVTCFDCHDPHGTDNKDLLIKPGSQMCLECHGPNSPNGPRGSLEEHTHHQAGSPGSSCLDCHMPRIDIQVDSFSVRSHTFRFISPALTIQYGIPNPCTSCHKHKTNQWALDQLHQWQNVSPWRLERRN